MIKVWMKKREIFAEVKVEIDRYWLNQAADSHSPSEEERKTEALVVDIKKELKAKVMAEVLNGFSWEINSLIEKEAKSHLYEILESEDFKAGLSQAVKDSFKNKFTDYLDRI